MSSGNTFSWGWGVGGIRGLRVAEDKESRKINVIWSQTAGFFYTINTV